MVTVKTNAWVTVEDYRWPGGWTAAPGERAREYCRRLEEGEILFFAGVPYEFSAADREFLLSQK